MVRLSGNKKINLAVFISGRGTNLKSIYTFAKKKSTVNLKLVISNNKNAKGLKFSKIKKINSHIISYNQKKIAENKILKLLKINKIDLVCLAGFMKILSPNFIKRSKLKIINIHPSLLPKYKGLNTHMRALANQDNFSGCTVHYVDKNLDSGEIILQKKVKINKTDSVKSLEKIII